MRAPFALLVDAASYLVSAFALGAIGKDEPVVAGGAERNLRREISEGVGFVVRDPYLRVMTIAPAIGNFCFIGYEAVVVVFLVRTVHLSPGAVGVLLTTAGAGSIVGAAVARPLGRLIGTSRAMWASMLVTAPFGLLTPLTSRGAGLAWFVVGNVIVFAGILVYNVTISAFRQSYCPPVILGRVVASMRFVLFGVIPLGALAGGALAQALGPRDALWVLLAANVVPGFVLIASPLRTTRALPAQPA